MKKFSGFPAGKVRFTALPNLFFSELLPLIDDLAELKVTLHIFWLLTRKKGRVRYVSLAELLSDGVLLGGLGDTAEDKLRAALERAVARGTLLLIETRDETQEYYWYFVNTEQGRDAAERARRGELQLTGQIVPTEPLAVERPNIFTLYEQNIGLLQPLIVEELKEAEGLYPADWVGEAFQIAAVNNVRRWSYVRKILENWAAHGKDERGKQAAKDEENRYRYIRGKYAEYVKH